MTNRSTSLVIVLAILLSVALSACGAATPSAPTATPAGDEPAATRTLPPPPTPFPTETSRPTATLPPTETPLPEPTGTPTVDPQLTDALAEVEMKGLAWYSDYDLLLSFDFPSPVDPSDYRVTLEDKEYACEVIAQYPNRLYCKGQGAKVLAVADVKVYPAGSSQPGFEQEVWVPYFTNNYADVPK